MQRSIGIALCFAIVLNAFGQDTSNVVKAVELARMNVLYVGLDNPIKVAISNIAPSELSVRIDNGTVTGRNGEYVIVPTDVGTATLSVYFKGAVVYESNYRVKSIPNTSVALEIPGASARPIKEGYRISKEDLLKAKGVRIIFENSDLEYNLEIVGFIMSMAMDGILLEANSSKGQMSDKQKKIIAKADHMSKIYIENIKVKGPDGKIRTMGSVVIRII